MGHFHSQILAQCRKKISSAVRNGCNLFAVKMPALARYFVPTGSVDFPITRKNHLLRCLCIKPQLLSNEINSNLAMAISASSKTGILSIEDTVIVHASLVCGSDGLLFCASFCDANLHT